MAEVKAKVNKAVVYKMISYKGKTGANNYTPLTAAQRLPKHERSISTGFTTLIAGLNALGATLNSIANNVQNMLEFWRDAISTQIRGQTDVLKQEKKTDVQEKKLEKKKEKQKFDQRKLGEREKDIEALKPKKKKFKSTLEKKETKKPSWLQTLFNALGTLVTMAVLKVVSENPETINKLVKVILAIGSFAAKAIEFLGGLALDGIIDFLENPISLKGFFGIFKFLLGAVPLFAAFTFLKNPAGSIKLVGKVMGGIISGLKRMFGMNSKADKLKQFKLKKLGGQKGNFFTSKAGKIGLGLGAGFATGTAIKAAGGTNAEAVGGGVGAAGGQMAGAALGAATGIPGMGVVGGMVGTMAGGAVGKAIGPMVEPIIEPMKEWFSMVGKVFNDVLADIKEPLEEFFTTLGKFMSQILEVVEPHLPMISKIISVGLQTMFAPLFLGIRALTAVMKLFTGGDKKKDEDVKPTKGKMDGGKVPPLAKGGWITGPQSGYPVSMDSGKSISFIGHGTEWVGRKRASGGFVIPFDTPATRTNRSLTARRYKEAARGGYTLPTYAWGGKWFKNKVSQVKDRLVDEQGNPKGAMRWLAGAADQATGGFFDFDKQGHSLYQASGVLQKSGDLIDNLKQKRNEERNKRLQAALDGAQPTVINNELDPISMGGGTQDSFPIIVPSDHDLDQDKYIMPKFGLIAEMKTDPVELM